MLSRQKEDKDLTHRRLTSLATVRSPGYDASSIGVVVEEGGNTQKKKFLLSFFLPFAARIRASSPKDFGEPITKHRRRRRKR